MRVDADPHLCVGPVAAGISDVEQDLAGAGYRVGPVGDSELLGPAGGVDDDGFHSNPPGAQACKIHAKAGTSLAPFHQRTEGGSDGNRRVHPDRQQRLADLDHCAAIQADLRAQQADRAAGRTLRARFRPLHDQAARLRRQNRVLGPQSRILHTHGGPRRRHPAHPALCLGGSADPSAGPSWRA